MNAAAASQLNGSSHGVEEGTSSPQGPSGEVELVSKIQTDVAKKNSPAHKKPTSTKSETVKPPKKSTTTTSTARPVPANTKPELAAAKKSSPGKPSTNATTAANTAENSGLTANNVAATNTLSPIGRAETSNTGGNN